MPAAPIDQSSETFQRVSTPGAHQGAGSRIVLDDRAMTVGA
jgi:hypothetical protein